MHAVESIRENGLVRQHFLWSLGKFDESTYLIAKELLKDWQPLKRAQILLTELEDPYFQYRAGDCHIDWFNEE